MDEKIIEGLLGVMDFEDKEKVLNCILEGVMVKQKVVMGTRVFDPNLIKKVLEVDERFILFYELESYFYGKDNPTYLLVTLLKHKEAYYRIKIDLTIFNRKELKQKRDFAIEIYDEDFDQVYENNYNKEKIMKILGEETYSKWTNIIVDHYNLKLKNALYKIF